MEKFQDVATIIGPPGLIPVVGVQVTIFNNGTSTNAAIYSSNSTSSAMGNPITTDASGLYSFYAADGHYDRQVSGAGIQTTLQTDILLQDMAAEAALDGFAFVKDFGAVGNGIADDTAAILSCIANATAGSDVIFNGVFLITSRITVNRPLRFIFTGKRGVQSGDLPSSYLLKASTLNDTALLITQNAFVGDGVSVIAQAGNGGDNIVINAHGVVLLDSTSILAGQDNIRIGDATGINCNTWSLVRPRCISGVRHGINIHDAFSNSAPNVNSGTLISPECRLNGGDGVVYGSARLNTQIAGTIENNTGAGLHLTANAKYNVAFGGDFEANTGKDLVIDSGGVSNTVINETLAAVNCTISEVVNKIDIFDFTSLTNGLKFQPTQVASADVNTLDDYEEGTWTPTITFGTVGDLSVSYSSQVGKYTKIGNLVTAHFEIITSAFTFTTSSGQFQIKGWPVNIAASVFHVGSLLMSGWTLASVSSLALEVASTTAVVVVASRSATTTKVLGTPEVPTGGSIVLVGDIAYRV
jgi:hypothetical protein